MNTNIPGENRDLVVGAAASLVWANLERVAADPLAPARKLIQAIRPVYGIAWNRAVIIQLGTENTNPLFCKLRNSLLPREEYTRLDTFIKDAFSAVGMIPPELLEWRVVAERYRFETAFGWEPILATLLAFQAQGIATPEDSGAILPADVHALCEQSPEPRVDRAFWGAQRANMTYGATAVHLIQPPGVVSPDSFLNSTKRHAKQFERWGKLRVRTSKKLKTPPNFARMGPAQRIKLFSSGQLIPKVVNRFMQENLQANLLKQVRGSLPGIASAFRCYLAFCELERANPLPPMEETVLKWSSVFNDTATFGNYISYLQKACFFLRQPTTWLTPAVRHVAKGLAKAQNKSFKFANFIRSQLLVEIIEHESTGSEFAQAAFPSFLFSFRVPSETLQLRRNYADGPLMVFSPQEEKAIIGVSYEGNGPYLVAKLSWRKNLPGGCILRRPCFCHLASPKARKLCPVHVFWKLIRRRVDPGQPLFPAVNRRNFNRILKAVLARMGIPEAERYSSHAFRRGAANELTKRGSQWSTVATLGEWRSLAFRGYVDLTLQLDKDMSKLLAETDRILSDDELEVKTLGA